MTYEEAEIIRHQGEISALLVQVEAMKVTNAQREEETKSSCYGYGEAAFMETAKNIRFHCAEIEHFAEQIKKYEEGIC